MPTQSSHATEMLFGVACGESLWLPVEFNPHHQITDQYGRVMEMLANGTHRQPAGAVTNNKELTLCIARSLDEVGFFDLPVVVDNFVDWYDSDPFDIGGLTVATLRRLATGGD